MAKSYKALVLGSGFEPQIKAHLPGVASVCCEEGARSEVKLLLTGRKHSTFRIVGGRNCGRLGLCVLFE